MKRIQWSFVNILTIARLGYSFYKSLPAIYELIDQRFPSLIGQASGEKVRELFIDSIKKVTGKRVTPGQVKAVASLYNPIIGAFKAFGSARG
jgi:hypothetical protein